MVGDQGLLPRSMAASAPSVHVNHVKLGIQPAGHAGRPGYHNLSRRIRTDAYRESLPYRPVYVVLLGCHVGFEAAVDMLGDLAEGQLAQGDEIAAAEKILEGLVNLPRVVDVAPAETVLQGLRGQVHHDGFVGHQRDPVGHGLTHGDAGNGLDGRDQAFHVLDVQGGDDVNLGGEDLLHVFVSFAVLAAGDIGVRKLVDEGHLRVSRENRLDVHLLKDGSAIFELAPGDGFELLRKIDDALAVVGFDDANHHVFTAAVTPDALSQHAVGLADAGGVAEKQFEVALGFLRGRGLLQPFFRFLDHGWRFRTEARGLRYNAGMLRRLPVQVLRFAAALGIILAIVFVYRKLFVVNPTAVALTFLLAILAVSTVQGNRCLESSMSVVAMVAFNYFFLPPVGQFTIADPQNWVALFVFLATSLIASELGTHARRQAEEAESRRRDVERLYAFSQRLLVSGNVISLLNAIPNHIVETFGVGAAALYVDYKQKFYRSGGGSHFSEEELKQATTTREELGHGREPQPRTLCARAYRGRAADRQPGDLRAGGFPGSETLDALGTLIGIAFERARAIEDLGKTEASREGERLKSALLDSGDARLSHTAFTSIKASVTSILRSTSKPESGPAGVADGDRRGM